MSLTMPVFMPWPENSNLFQFINIYDWDILLLDQAKPVALAIQLELCIGILPCSLFVASSASEHGVLKVIGAGSIICSRNSECSGISLHAVHIECQQNTGLVSTFKIQGANLTVVNSSFSGCFSQTDGGIIQSFDQAVVNIYSSSFQDTYSSGFGGAVCSVGSSLSVFDCEFLNCSSLLGGGAVWASTFVSTYGSSVNTISASIHIESCIFTLCKSERGGGALTAFSGLSRVDGLIYIEINSSDFKNCTSRGNGGALHFIGANVQANVGNTLFKSCHSDTLGGGISAEDFAMVVLVDALFQACSAVAGGAITAIGYSRLDLYQSSFTENYAKGAGGGAINIVSSELTVRNCSCRRNRAPFGGGGAVLFQGETLSSYQIQSPHQMYCSDDNSAVYGNCLASKYGQLEILDFPSRNFSVYPGSYIHFSIVKKDIYGQTILTDSSSILQLQQATPSAILVGTLLMKVQNGRALFSVSVSPLFAQQDYNAGRALALSSPTLYVMGADSEETMCKVSNSMITKTMVVTTTNSSSVCPTGSILVLDQNGFGSCSTCGPGSYSVHPLAGIQVGIPVCLSCPAGGICPGGSIVTFNLGSWILVDGIFQLISCPDGHQLVNSFNGLFRQEAQQCLECKPPQYVLNSNNSKFVCQVWQAAIYVEISVTLQISVTQFNGELKLELITAVAMVANVSISSVVISSFSSKRRSTQDSVNVKMKVAAQTVGDAEQVRSKCVLSDLNEQLNAAGLPAASEIAAAVVSSTLSGATPINLVIGACIGGFIVLLALAGVGYYVTRVLAKQAALKAFLVSFRNAKAGDEAKSRHLPIALQKDYVAEQILGKGAFGLVVQAKRKGTSKPVAVKIIVPEKGAFDGKELRQLRREENVLDLFTLKKCEHAVSLVGIGAVKIKTDLAWFIMELLNGDNMEEYIHQQSFSKDTDCIKMSRNVLAALKVMHAEGLVHRDIKPANIMRCRIENAGEVPDEVSFTFKLVDFGTALGIDDKVAKECMMTLVSSRQMGAGTPPYMSPEMFKDPENATYSSDLWSLGVSMFEIVTGTLPFESENELLWSLAIAGNMDEHAPNVLDKLDEQRRSTFDNNLAKTIAKALEKKVANRYQTTDEMHDAVYLCLIDKGEAFYSVFISYRVASEAPLARLIFDELNHAVTPGGHRVTVYWDAHRLVKGEDWEEGFATGLLNSMCIFPLLSYGSTAPLAALPEDQLGTEDAIRKGWEDRPVGRARLQGLESDCEDNVLKEFLIASTLLKRQNSRNKTPEEKGILKVAYPILIGRQQPIGHPEYPRMGNFFQVQGGGGKYPDQPSPPTNRAVAKFLKEKANMPPDVCESAEKMSVKLVMDSLTKLQGCQLYNHPHDLSEVDLSREQSVLLGKGCAGPPSELGGVTLTEEQKSNCRCGLDERQLRMLKAEVRQKRADMFEIIDRAFASSTELLGHEESRVGSFSGTFKSIPKNQEQSSVDVTAHITLSNSSRAFLPPFPEHMERTDTEYQYAPQFST
jgi:serine/threonine protein kinase